jgi:hypothetical protein
VSAQIVQWQNAFLVRKRSRVRFPLWAQRSTVRSCRCGTALMTVRAKPGYPSGQRGQTVNLLALAFEGSNPSPGTVFKRSEGILEVGTL